MPNRVPMKKNSVDLIWSIGELSSLFEKRTNMGGFLQDVVERIAQHMESDVCSVYLYDEEADTLVLRATHGLNRELVGQVQLRLGEGITGTALKELRPIREARAGKSPRFKPIPNLGEEQYESFLAVPIKRGLNRIGVMVLQHHQSDYFDVQDARAIQAITSQLAATLENVEILMELHGSRAQPEQSVAERQRLFVGRPLSEGIGRGSTVSFGQRGELIHASPVGGGNAPEGCARFEAALRKAQEQLEVLQIEIEDDFADVASLIFNSHLLMLKDDQFSGAMIREIENGASPEQAVITVVNQYVTLFSQSRNSRVQEKTQDVKDLGHRLVRNLSGDPDVEGDYRGQVLLATELYPSELVKIAAQQPEALILQDGGVTAHIAVLARSMALPVVLCRDERLFGLPDGTPVLVDAVEGNVYVDPEQEVIDRYRESLDAIQQAVAVDIPEQTISADRERVHLLANINIFHDARAARKNKAEGIGLYRSEFPFIVQNTFPTEEEQYRIYRQVIESVEGKPVTMRTLDVGGDKILPHADLHETNPFLGFRGIRFCLAHPEIFRDQLRALLRAGEGADLRLMLPMISSVDEFDSACALLEECRRQLADEGIPHNGKPLVGAMIELPSAVEMVHVLARKAGFLSIGSNDLVMYLLGVDRANERVGHMYIHYHPAVLRALKRVAVAAARARCPLSICGEAAADEHMLPFLLGIGIRILSVEPRQLPRLKQLVSRISIRDARGIARRMLSFERVEQVRRYLESNAS
ncbi:MAG: phosphoenolpyruvate--protein phosphotransferase [Spirochaetaceae bacterium]|nr:MAG: phosphoenolpyruvate--protein phosphotransferase [Spirochaetaceae bacterium]